MVRYCCVKGCKSTWNPISHVSFFNFPFKNQERFDKWVQIVPSNSKITKNSSICSKHFEQTDFNHEGFRRCLKKSAVPSIFGHNDTINVVNEPVEIAHEALNRKTNENHDPLSKVPGETEPMNISEDETSVVKETAEIIVAGASSENSMPISQHATNTPQSKSTIETSNSLMRAREREESMRRQVFKLQKENRRLQRKCQKMAELVKNLKEKGNCTGEFEKILKEKCSGFDFELFQNQVNNSTIPKTRHRYTDNIKEFATTVYLLSSDAYRFLRTVFHLPEESVLRKMIALVNCEEEI